MDGKELKSGLKKVIVDFLYSKGIENHTFVDLINYFDSPALRVFINLRNIDLSDFESEDFNDN